MPLIAVSKALFFATALPLKATLMAITVVFYNEIGDLKWD
jgi:hypothetical protein